MADEQQYYRRAKKLFEVGDNYEAQHIRARFKELALIYHPDRGGTKLAFEALVDMYKCLHRRLLHSREADFNTMRHAARSATHAKAPPETNPRLRDGTEGDFSQRFNAFYEAHHLPDPNDVGYNDFIQETEVRVTNDNYAIAKYNEPTPLVLGRGGLGCSELGVRQSDFSGEEGRLLYTDYRRAHTTGKLIDEATANARADFRSIEDYERYRDRHHNDPVTEEETVRTKEYLRSLEKVERDRLRRLQKADTRAFDHFDKVNQLRI
jgi:hypothetical protein